MGTTARYLAFGEPDIEQLKSLDNKELDSLLGGWDSDPNIPEFDLDQLWDSLHFLLTGFCFLDCFQVDEEKRALSQSVTGTGFLSAPTYMGFTGSDDVKRIRESLDQVDIDDLVANVSYDEFSEADLHPEVRDEEDFEFLLTELKDAFISLRDFYREAADRSYNVMAMLS